MRRASPLLPSKFRGQNAGLRISVDSNGTEVFLTADAFRLHLILNRGDRAQRKLGGILRTKDVKILHVGKLRAFLRTKPDDDRDLLVSFSQRGNDGAVDRAGGGIGDIAI